MNWELFTLAGLALDIAGAVFIFSGVVTSLQEAKAASTAYYADEDGLVGSNNPSVIAMIREGHRALIGPIFLGLGFALQAVAPIQSLLASS